jgi:hypothetical protein
MVKSEYAGLDTDSPHQKCHAERHCLSSRTNPVPLVAWYPRSLLQNHALTWRRCDAIHPSWKITEKWLSYTLVGRIPRSVPDFSHAMRVANAQSLADIVT